MSSTLAQYESPKLERFLQTADTPTFTTTSFEEPTLTTTSFEDPTLTTTSFEEPTTLPTPGLEEEPNYDDLYSLDAAPVYSLDYIPLF